MRFSGVYEGILRCIEGYWDAHRPISTFVDRCWDILWYMGVYWGVLRRIEMYWNKCRYIEIFWDILGYTEM
mgnify:CR=1 FL=1